MSLKERVFVDRDAIPWGILGFSTPDERHVGQLARRAKRGERSRDHRAEDALRRSLLFQRSVQAAKVDALKSEWPDFAAMRRLAMRFRGILRSENGSKLAVWLKDAQLSGLYAMQR